MGIKKRKAKEIKSIICLIMLSLSVIFASLTINASPEGGNVVSGNITIGSDQGNGIDTLVTQLSEKGIIDWRSFGIGETEHTHFAQPSASAVTLNRVTGGDPSSILGKLTATGQIMLINPAGILFGPRAIVDVAGLIATTANISNENFLAGNYHFIQGPNVSNDAKIINQGYIKVADHGMVALVAPSVENSGIIEANLGKVVLGATPSGSTYTLDFYGDQLLQFALSEEANQNIDTAIKQSGRITAHGGKILLSANTAKSIVDRAINMSGIIEANSVGTKGGEVVLMGGGRGVVEVTGKITARGNRAGERGGKVKVLGEKVGLFQGAEIDVSGMSGGGEVLVGGDYMGGGDVPTATATYVDEEAKILANAIQSGDGGKVIIWSDDSTRFYGTIEAKGGEEGGSGGFVETSSKNWLDVSGAHIDLSAANGDFGTWLLDPHNVTISNDMTSGGSWSGDFWTPSSDNAHLNITELLDALLLGGRGVNNTGGGGGGEVGNIIIDNEISSAYAATLQIIAYNEISINDPISATNLNLLLQTSVGDININAALDVASLETGSTSGVTNIATTSINTVGEQTYNTPVILQSDTSLQAEDGMTFAHTLDSDSTPRSLTIDVIGNVIFGDAVGTTNSLKSLSISSISAAQLQILGGSVSTVNEQEYYNIPVMIGADTMLTSTSGGDITFFNSTLDSDGTARVLAVNTSGGTTFGGDVGATNALSSLTTDSGGTTKIGDYYEHNLTITTTGAQTYNDAVVLGRDVIGATATLTSTGGGNITFANTLDAADSARILAINTSGNTIFGGAVGATNSLNRLTTDSGGQTQILGGSVSTVNAQTYNDALILGADTTLTSSGGGDITFANTLNSDGTPRALAVNTSGSTIFDGVITADALNNLTTNVGGTTQINNGTITTTGAQTYNDAVVLGANTTLTSSGGGDITFANTLNSDGTPRILAVNTAGNTIFGGIVGATNALISLTTNVGGTTQINASGITTSGTQTYNDAVELGADTVLTSTGGSDITFANTLNSDGTPRVLAVNTVGNTIFGGIVGATNALSSLTTNVGGTTQINASGITTVGAQTYNDALTLGADTTLASTSGGDITFANTLNNDGTVRSLAVNTSGSTIFNGTITADALSNLTTNVGGTTQINNGTITTTGAQTYNDAVVLGANTTLTSSGGGNITFVNTLDSDGTSRILAVNTVGNTIFSGIVGGTSALSSLTTNVGGTTQINTSGITTSGAQTYNDAVTLGADTALTSTGGSDITFANTLDSDGTARILAVNTVGNTIFSGVVGGSNALGGLTTNVGGATQISGEVINTQGAQTYNDAVLLGNNTFLRSGSGDITFGSTINNALLSPYNLVFDTSGNITFSGAVGSLSNPLNSLLIMNANNVTAETYIYVNSFLQMAGTGTTGFVYHYDAFGNPIPTLFTTPAGSDGHGTGYAYISTNSVYGAIDVGAPFYLGANQADLYGYVGGVTGTAGVKNISLLRTILPATNFFEGIDLFTASLKVSDVLPYSQVEEILTSFEEDVFTKFMADYLDMFSEDEELDELLLDPLAECTIEVTT